MSFCDKEKWSNFHNNPEDIYKDARYAKNPFQYLANMTILYNGKYKDWLAGIPITQDASASAYQIMSYLLLDKKLAIKTNLIKNKKPKMEYIQDIYEDMFKDLKVYISNEKPTKELTEPLKRVLIKNLDRKLVKSVYMPLIYGKTLMSTVKDIIAKLSRHITRKDGFTAAQIFFKYFIERYKTVDNLIQLIRDIAWLVTSANRVVRIQNEFMCTLQDYLCHEKINVYVQVSIR